MSFSNAMSRWPIFFRRGAPSAASQPRGAPSPRQSAVSRQSPEPGTEAETESGVKHRALGDSIRAGSEEPPAQRHGLLRATLGLWSSLKVLALTGITARAYGTILLAVFLGLVIAKELRARAAELTCWSGGYRQNAWMAYCNSDRYGVYDTEAIWHHIEPDVAPSIQAAQVLTLSDSKMQNALSLGGAGEWFALHHTPLYLLGLPHAESEFAIRLLENFKPHPDLVILDASPYFTGDVGYDEQSIFKNPEKSRADVTALKDYQAWHQRFCATFAWACGHNFAYFRSRVDGHWIFPTASPSFWIGHNSVPNDDHRFPTGEKVDESVPLYPVYLANARRLVEKLNMPSRCIVITHVPSEYDLRGLADYIGTHLGLTVIQPRVADLYTFDQAHLTPRSAARWTRAFLTELEPVLQDCATHHAAVVARAESAK